MIKSLSNITNISVIDQNASKDILTFSKIEFDDNEVGSGGFGSVYNVQSIDGISKSEFVLKIITHKDHKQHAYDVIQLLHHKLKKHQLKTKTPIYHDIPELLGLPFMVFKGYDNISEKHCVAFLMYNLVKLDFVDYGSDTTNHKEYRSLTIPDKLYLAYQLTKTVDFLHQIEFIHADLSENSLWFNSKRIQLSVIDYDSGYHFDSQDKPTTIGKVGHWIGSRFRNIIGQKKDSSDLTTIDRLYEEYWVLANATFEVVFGVMPFFFLSDLEDSTMKSYLNDFEWPNIDYSSPLFNQSNNQQHHTIVSFIEQINNAGAEDLINAFKQVFNKGYNNESKRLTAGEWKDLLLKLNQSLESNPMIKNFESNKTEIRQKNEKVDFSIDIKKYNAIYLNDKLIPVHQELISIPLPDANKIVIKVVNDFNIIEDYIVIKAIKVDPKIKKFNASTLLRDSISPVNLTWVVEDAKDVSISELKKRFSLISNLEVEPLNRTTYILTANGFFDEKIKKELIIDVVTPTIKSFTYEINLNEGINNIDLQWETEKTESVSITPYVNETSINGLVHVSINKETTFKLLAKGLFNNVEKEITAHPFPIPIVKQIFAEAPKIEINTNLDFAVSNLPKELFSINNVKFSNSVNFNNLEIDSTELNNAMKIPTFENENSLIKKFNKNKISLSNVYDSLLQIIYEKLNK